MVYENFFYEKYKKNIFSQNGEDGVIEEILQRLNLEDQWCCEFGAWDGKHLSNTFNLITKGYKAVLIEGDERRYLDLVETSKEYSSIIPINKFVNLTDSTLDEILSKTNIPKDFSLLSIDIDSYDYQIWDSLKNYTPIIVVIEIHSGKFPLDNTWIHDDKKKINSTSFLPMYNLGKSKGYEFLLHTGNMFFIRKDYFNKLNINHPQHFISNFNPSWINIYKNDHQKYLNFLKNN